MYPLCNAHVQLYAQRIVMNEYYNALGSIYLELFDL